MTFSVLLPNNKLATCSPKHISCLASQQYLSTMASGDLALGRCESHSNPSGSWIIRRKRPSKSFAQKDASWLKCKMNPCNLGLNDRNSRTLPFACFVLFCFSHFTTKHFQHCPGSCPTHRSEALHCHLWPPWRHAVESE